MLNIVDLESRWLRYKIKSFIPYGVIALSLIVISALLFFYFNADASKKSSQKEKTTTVIQEEQVVQKKVELLEKNSSKATKQIAPQKTEPVKPIEPVILEQKTEQEVVLQESNARTRRTLVPSMDFMKEMQNSSQPDFETTHINEKPQTQDRVKEIVQEIVLQNRVNETEESQVAQKEQQIKISITKQNKEHDIAGVIKRFKKNNNPALSLFVAKKYYELGDYHNAYNYALITNEINSEIEASWILFAKSLVKLKKKDMAIKTLSEYINHTHSDSAQILLDEIRSGQFQ